MFIQTSSTPNPNAMKFMPGQIVSATTPYSFQKTDIAISCPLSRGIFSVDGVNGVYMGEDFVTITKDATTEWSILKPEIIAVMQDYFGTHAESPHVTLHAGPHAKESSECPITDQIKEIIETRVRPAVAQDGGDIVFHSFTDGVVFLQLHGACSGCPSSTQTLKSGIENMLKFYVPEVQEVRAFEGEIS